METLKFDNLTMDEVSELNGGGWLTVVGGGLMVVGALVSGGPAIVVIGGVAGGVLTMVSGL